MVETKTKKWYILRVAPLRDKKIPELIKKAYLKSYGDEIEVVAPTHDEITVVNNQRVVKNILSTPGYVIVETDDILKLKHVIADIKEILGIMGDNRKGIFNTLSTTEVEKLIGDKKINDPTVPVKIADEVLVLEGAFSGFKGLISKYDESKKLVTVDISIFGRKTPVEIDLKGIKRTTS